MTRAAWSSEVARYVDGLRVATNLFEAAAWRKSIDIRCSRCDHSRIHVAVGLWWLFQRKGWDDRLGAVRRRLYCSACQRRASRGPRVRPRVLDIIDEKAGHHCLEWPPEYEWKRALSRFRG